MALLQDVAGPTGSSALTPLQPRTNVAQQRALELMEAFGLQALKAYFATGAPDLVSADLRARGMKRHPPSIDLRLMSRLLLLVFKAWRAE